MYMCVCVCVHVHAHARLSAWMLVCLRCTGKHKIKLEYMLWSHQNDCIFAKSNQHIFKNLLRYLDNRQMDKQTDGNG